MIKDRDMSGVTGMTRDRDMSGMTGHKMTGHRVTGNSGMKRKTSAVLAVFLAAVLALFGCGSDKKEEAAAAEQKPEDLTVSVMTPEVSSIVLQGEFIGTLEPEEQTTVAAKMSGEVTNQYFEVGDFVKKGDVLFTLDDTASRLQLENAQATYTAAQAGAVQQMGSLDLQMAQAQNSLEQAQNGITTAENGITTAENGVASAIDGYDKVKGQREELEGSLSDVESAKNKANDYYQTLNGLNGRLNSLKEKIDLFGQTGDIPTKSNLAAEIAGMLGTDTSNIGLSCGTIEKLAADTTIDSTVCTVRFEDQNLKQLGLSVASLPSATTSAKSAYDTASSSYSQMKSSIGTLEGQETSLYNSKTSAITGYNNAVTGYDNAVSGKTLAEKNYAYTANVAVPGTAMTVQSQLKQAEIAVESAKLQLGYSKVAAPVSGRIDAINVSQYGMTQAGSPAYVITNADNVVVNFKVSETVMKNLAPDQPVYIEKDGEKYQGYITEIADSVDAQSGLFKVKAVVEGDKNAFYNGATVKLTLDTQRAEDVMALPIDTVYYEDGRPYVYCAEGKAAAKTYVETGLFNDDIIEITGGLTADSRIITSWSPQLRDGVVIVTEGGEAASLREDLPRAGEASLLMGYAGDGQGDRAYE